MAPLPVGIPAILGGSALASKLGLAGAAAGAAALAGNFLLGGHIPFIRIPATGGSGSGGAANIINNAASAGPRWRRLVEAAKEIGLEAVKDILKDTLEKTVTTPFALMTLTDALGYWVTGDLLLRASYHPALHVPTAESFSKALDYMADTVGAFMLVDLVSNRDVGSDLAESVIDAFAESVLGDTIKTYLDTVSGTSPVDDDEIRDIVSEGATQSPEELAYIGARSGLDTFSAMAELYTGLLQGDNPYFARAVREVDEVLKRFERGLAADTWLLGSLVERIGEDVIDAIYWYLSVLDGIENRLKTIVRDMAEAYAAYRAGGLDEGDFDGLLNVYQNELDALLEAVQDLYDEGLAGALIDEVIEEYRQFADSIPISLIREKAEAVLDDAARRLTEHAEKAAEAYTKISQIRRVTVS